VSPPERPRIYVCHPMTCYGTDHAATSVAGIAKALSGAQLIDPEHCGWTCNGDWLRDWPGLLASLAGVVVFTDRSGTIGAGCVREIADAVAAGVALAAWEPGVGLVDLVGVELVEPESRGPQRAAFVDYGSPIAARLFPGGAK